jgi:hypothetical protein
MTESDNAALYKMVLLLAEGKRLNHLKEKPYHKIPYHNLSVLWRGPRSRRYGRTTTLRLLVQPYDEEEDYDDDYYCPFPGNGAPME